MDMIIDKNKNFRCSNKIRDDTWMWILHMW